MTALDKAASPAPVTADELPALRRRITAVLIASQILGGLGVATGIALATVLAQQVSGTEALSGLAPTATVAGTAVLSMPLAALMTARGRRPGLVLAYLLGALGACVVVLAAVVDNFPLLLLGMAAFGAGSSANLQARFAAADLAEPERRARAISNVVWATTIGAVLGPNIAAPAGRSVSGLGIPAAAGPFVWAAGVFLVSAVLVLVLLRPDPLLTARALSPADRSPEGRSLRAGMRAVRESPMARLALVTVAASHTAMVSIMSMTPVALSHHGAGIELIGLVISAHIAGMYAFSPVMGWLADRIGRLAVIGLAAGLLSLAALLAGDGGGEPWPDRRRALRSRPRLVRGPGLRLHTAHRFGAAARPRRRAGPVRPDHEHLGGHRRRCRRADRRAGELRLAERGRRLPALADGGSGRTQGAQLT